jgi:hypothetical protein
LALGCVPFLTHSLVVAACEFSGFIVSLAEQTLVQGVLLHGWCVRRTIPQQQAAMIIGAFRLGIFVEKAAIA